MNQTEENSSDQSTIYCLKSTVCVVYLVNFRSDRSVRCWASMNFHSKLGENLNIFKRIVECSFVFLINCSRTKFGGCYYSRVFLLKTFAWPDFSIELFNWTNLINCAQTKFVTIILVLSVFYYAIFRLTDFLSDAFDFSSSKTG